MFPVMQNLCKNLAPVLSRHVHGSEMTRIWDPYSGNGSGDTALINAAMYGA